MEKPDKLQEYLDAQKESFAAAIEKAYMQGYKDAVEEQAKEYIKIVEDGVEYLDLGLPSGTLWALKSPRLVTYKESQRLNIPTKEQIQELTAFVRWTSRKRGNWDIDWRLNLTDCDGREYCYYTGSDVWDYKTPMVLGNLYMWYREDVNLHGAPVYCLEHENKSSEMNIFPGYKAYAFLVK